MHKSITCFLLLLILRNVSFFNEWKMKKINKDKVRCDLNPLLGLLLAILLTA